MYNSTKRDRNPLNKLKGKSKKEILDITRSNLKNKKCKAAKVAKQSRKANR